MKKFRTWLVGLSALAITALALRADIISPLPFTFTNGQVIDAGQFNANFAAIVTGVNTNAATAGANFNITSLNGLTTAIPPSLGGSTLFGGGVSTGSANAQSVTSLIPNNYTLTAGFSVTFSAGFSNTGPMTLSINGTTATSVYAPSINGPIALSGGEVVTGNPVAVFYDGTRYVLTGTIQSTPTGTITDWTSSSIPAGWLATDGTCYLQATYPRLYGLIGTSFGSCAAGQFAVPDLRGRNALMADGSAGRVTTATCATPSTIGAGCGSQTTTLTSTNQFPPYTPTGTVSTPTITVGQSLFATLTGGTGGGNFYAPGSNPIGLTATSSTPTFTGVSVGASAAIPALPPVLVVNKIIKF